MGSIFPLPRHVGLIIVLALCFSLSPVALSPLSVTAQPALVINEVDADTPGSDTLEFIELYDGGAGNTALDGLVLVLYNGADNASYRAFDLDGFSTDANGYFLLGNSAVTPEPDIIFGNGTLQNGPDAVALYTGDAADFPNDTPVTTTNLLDAIVYHNDTADPDGTGLLILLNTGQSQVNENGAGDKDSHSNQRCPNGSGDTRNTDTYIQAIPSPAATNTCDIGGIGEFGSCGDAATLIHTIQGSDASSPLRGASGVVIEGVVVGDFQDTSSELGGFFVQEEDDQADANPATSEGIFVFDNGSGFDVAEGDVVRVQGSVTEFFELTELTNIDAVAVCGSGASVTATEITFPLTARDDLEPYEGMRVTFPQELTITEVFNLGRFGEVGLSQGGRLFNPTNIVAPGPAAGALQAENDLRRILLDDGSNVQNPDPIIYPTPELSATNTLRAGDTVMEITGVLSYAFGEYRVHPTTSPSFASMHPRAPEPADVGGTLRVASFNVLNYFNGDGTGGGFPTARGADSLAEFNRQRDKIIAAIRAIDADIVGLVELENDGYGPDSAIQDLVNGLNATDAAYAFIDPGVASIGSDAIAVGFIYQPDAVTPAGAAAILDSSVDPDFIDSKNRPALAQTFTENATGEKVPVVVNHLKSKGSDCDDLGDPDTGDGQGNCNQTRTRAAVALTEWLATDPTGSADPDILIIGDLNAYAQEDPITAITGAGYTNLIGKFVGAAAYSFVFFGQAGYLDHALASASLTPRVTDVTEWHINADEPRVLDYNTENKSAGQLTSLYRADPYRSADHDPVVIGLNLAPKVYLPMVAR